MRARYLCENAVIAEGSRLQPCRMHSIKMRALAPEGFFVGLLQTLKAIYGSVIYGPQQSESRRDGIAYSPARQCRVG
jgi:hypothetical protein